MLLTRAILAFTLLHPVLCAVDHGLLGLATVAFTDDDNSYLQLVSVPSGGGKVGLAGPPIWYDSPENSPCRCSPAPWPLTAAT